MAIQLPNTGDNDFMLGVMNRVAQKRFAMQQRDDENARYKDAQARADEALKWDKEKYADTKKLAREQMGIHAAATAASNRYSDLQSQKMTMELDRAKADQHAGEFGMFMSTALNSPSTAIDVGGKTIANTAHLALQKDATGKLQFRDELFGGQVFGEGTKSTWLNAYMKDAVARGVRPSLIAFETLFTGMREEEKKNLREHIIGFKQANGISDELWQKKVGGVNYNTFAAAGNPMNADPMMFPAGGTKQTSDGDFPWVKMGGSTLGAGLAAKTAWNTTSRYLGSGKALKEIRNIVGEGGSQLSNPSAWQKLESLFPKIGSRGVSKLSAQGITATEGALTRSQLSELAAKISTMGDGEATTFLAGLAKKLPPSIWQKAAVIFRSGAGKAGVAGSIIAALAAAGYLGYEGYKLYKEE
jgi:hypothetical protein